MRVCSVRANRAPSGRCVTATHVRSSRETALRGAPAEEAGWSGAWWGGRHLLQGR